MFNGMITFMLAKFCLNDLPHAAKLFESASNPASMEEWEKWEALMASIRKAAKILNIEITEQDVPEYLNWSVGRAMHEDLWAQVYARGKRKLESGNPVQYGTCYEDAWHYVIKEEEGELIHGTAISLGRRLPHAWVELPAGYIWEPYSGGYLTKNRFQELADPIEEHRYTVEEAAIMVARVGKHGPWSGEERATYLRR